MSTRQASLFLLFVRPFLNAYSNIPSPDNKDLGHPSFGEDSLSEGRVQDHEGAGKPVRQILYDGLPAAYQ